MLEEDLDRFTKERQVYDTFALRDWRIDCVDNNADIILLSDNMGNKTEMTLEYFNKHCLFVDELWSDRPMVRLKCECGVDKLGYGNHSDYCPKYKGK